MRDLPPSQAKIKDWTGWPRSQEIGDVLRAMVVCGYRRYKDPMKIWNKIRERFRVSKCAPRFSREYTDERPCPPDMCAARAVSPLQI